ncbi:aspartate/ornithine carbamoyltransferase family protein [Streptomyces sp. NPDC004436]
MADTLKGADLLSMRRFGRLELEALFDQVEAVARRPRQESLRSLNGHILVSAFYQNSTRTRLSHESAMLRLGGRVAGFADPASTRAGDHFQESLGDIATMLSHYGDVIVLRHPQTGAAESFAAHATVPVINAGDGWGEHPTQALADLYTVREHCGGLDGTTWILSGDLRMRTMRSVLLGLRHYSCTVLLAHPDDMSPDLALIEEVRASGCSVERISSITEGLPRADAVYMEPVVQPDYGVGRQPARADKPSTPTPYKVDRAMLASGARPELLVLHSLPRLDELSPDVDATPHNGYWREAANAVHVRMALLEQMLGE